MQPRIRNLVGILALIAGLVVYSLLVMQIGAAVTHWPALVQALFYLVAGLIWLWPARALLKWMAHRR